MRRVICIGSFLILSALPALGSLRFGLGHAVAKRSAELIDKAGANNPLVGDNAAASLPSCVGNDLYDTFPTDMSQIAAIEPLGHVAPSPHTFPSDHIYFYRPSGATVALPIYAPGNMHIVRIASSEVISSTPTTTDYGIYFYPCREVKSYFAHVQSLSASLQNLVGTLDQNCTTYTTGATFRACNKNIDVAVASGEIIGYTKTSGAFDFGTYDYRRTPLAWATPSRHIGDQPYTACPLDYFTSGLQASMKSIVGLFDGTHLRTATPICGQIMYDVPGTAKGVWYFPGAPDIPEDPHLSLIDSNVFAPWQTISIGDSLPNQPQSFFTFVPVSGAGIRVDRDFSEVTADGHIYCYDTFYDPLGNPGGGLSFLIQMPTATTLKIESQPAATCDPDPNLWAFTSNAVTFQR